MLITHGRPIGSDQWIVTFGLHAQSRKKYADPTLPKRMSVRLIRMRYRKNGKTKQMWLVTTLLDATLSVSRHHRVIPQTLGH